jgi:alpha-tubulin suppressor-like RCC1 family protein
MSWIQKSLRLSTVTLSAAALLAAGAVAAPMGSTEAAKAAGAWLRVEGSPARYKLGGQVGRVESFTAEDGQPAYHIVHLTPSGFIIVAGDDDVQPVVGFSSGNAYDPSPKNPLGALVHRDVTGRVQAARAGATAAPSMTTAGTTPPPRARWKELLDRADAATTGAREGWSASVTDPRVDPMVQSKWGQDTVAGTSIACYNYYTPPGSAGNYWNYPSGCVATAMAQLMRFYQYPTTGVGTGVFDIYVDGYLWQRALRGGNGAGGPYAWSNMPLVPTSSISSVQAQAIGALMHDAGLSVHMDYSWGVSSSDTLDAAGALRTVFKYSNAVKGFNNYSNIGAGLASMVNPNLDAGYPVLFGITSTSMGGHAVVCDGYGFISYTAYHHLNLGWSGSDDAWYNLPTIDTSQGTFDTLYKCLYNIYPSGSGEIISGRVLDETTFAPVSGAVVDAMDTTTSTHYTATTNARGIYAIAKLPSSRTFTVSVTAPGHSYPSRTVNTGRSTDFAATSGNVWAADFGAGMANLFVDSAPTGQAFSGTITGTGPVSGTTPANFLMVYNTAATLTVPSVASGTSVPLYFNKWVDDKGSTLSVSPTVTAVMLGFPRQITALYSGKQNKGYVLDWGYNNYGQLGDGGNLQSNSPYVVNPLLDAASVAAGDFHTLILMGNGTLYAQGNNYYGQLGDGTTQDRTTPTVINGLPANVVQIAAGSRHSLAVTADGTVYAWGSNDEGQLGLGASIPEKLTPTLVTALTNIVQIAAGESHSLAMARDGVVWAFGANTRGQLGDGTTTDQPLPVQVNGLPKLAYSQAGPTVSAGWEHSMALLADGSVYTWGAGNVGQLGNRSTQDSLTPVSVNLGQAAKAIAAGWLHCLAVLSNGAVRSWGSNAGGQLGYTNSQYGYGSYSPAPIAVIYLTKAVSVAAGGYHSGAIDANGAVWMWGWGRYGQLGDGTTPYYGWPKPLTRPTAIKALAAGAAHTVVVADQPNGAPPSTTTTTGTGPTTTTTSTTTTTGTGPTTTTTTTSTSTTTTSTTTTTTSTTTTTLPSARLFVTGANSSGQLGLGDAIDRAGGVAVAAIPDAMIMTGGQWHSFVVRPNGTLWGAGVNAYGQLGRADTNTFQQVSGVAGVLRVACSDWHSLVLLNNGTLMSTGVNSSGALGLGDNAYRTVFTAVPGVSGIKAIAAGSYHSVAVATDGSLWVTGSNTSGQIGLGATASVRSFTKVSGVTNAVAAAAGEGHTLVLLSNGTLLAAGLNSNGQLGMGNTTGRTVFTAVPGVTGVAAVAARGIHSVALKSDGSVWVAGCYKGIGRVADTTLFARDPVLSGITAIATGTWHTLALKSNGTLWVTGANDRGQLGLGDKVQRDTFVQAATFSGVVQVGAGALHSLVAASALVTTTTTLPGTTTTTIATTTTTSTSTTTTTTTLPSAGYQLLSTGKNQRGQLGLGDTTNRSVFTSVTGMNDIISVAVGSDNALAVRQGGAVLGVGAADYGKLGSLTGTLTTFTTIPELSAGLAAAASSNHTVVLARDGSVWGSGINYYGQLGLGDTTNRAVFTRVTGLTGIVAVAVGEGYTLALKSDGTVWGTGNNGYGQLGLGAATRVLTFTQVPNVTQIAGVFAGGVGGNHSFLLRRDGLLMASGWNANGQLGLADKTNRSSFTVVPGISSVRAVAVGPANTAAVRADGTLWTTGAALQNAIAATTTFALLTNATGVYSVDFCAGDLYVLMLTNGALRVAGTNASGELGVGDTSARAFLTSVSGLSNLQSVVAGGATAMVLLGNAPPTTTTTIAGGGAASASARVDASAAATTTTTVAASVTSAATTLSRVEKVVDNSDRAAAARWQSLGGAWSTLAVSGAYGGDCVVAAGVNGAETARCAFAAPLMGGGAYDVYVRWPTIPNATASAAFEIHAAGGIATVRLDQTREAGQWVRLGTHAFADRGVRVELHNGGSGFGRAVAADAVRFVPAGR